MVLQNVLYDISTLYLVGICFYFSFVFFVTYSIAKNLVKKSYKKIKTLYGRS